jgi:hypothetical protein
MYNTTIFFNIFPSTSIFKQRQTEISSIEKEIQNLTDQNSKSNNINSEINKLKEKINILKNKLTIYEKNEYIIKYNQLEKEYKIIKEYLNSIKTNDKNNLNDLINELNNIELLIQKKIIYLALINKFEKIFKEIDFFTKNLAKVKKLSEIESEYSQKKNIINENQELIEKAKKILEMDPSNNINELISESLNLSKLIKLNEDNENQIQKLQKVNLQIKLKIIENEKNNLKPHQEAKNIVKSSRNLYNQVIDIVNIDFEEQTNDFNDKITNRKLKNYNKNNILNNDISKKTPEEEKKIIEKKENLKKKIQDKIDKKLNNDFIKKETVIVNNNELKDKIKDAIIDKELSDQEKDIQNRLSLKKQKSAKIMNQNKK